jgi:hypothetical protein
MQSPETQSSKTNNMNARLREILQNLNRVTSDVEHASSLESAVSTSANIPLFCNHVSNFQVEPFLRGRKSKI